MELKKQDVYLPIKAEPGEDTPLQIKINDVWYWLKPIKDVYVLTEVELTNIKMQEWSKGHQKGYENLRVHTHTDSDYDQ